MRRKNRNGMPILLLAALALATMCHAEGNIEPPGLMVTFQDDARSISKVVALPELGLAAEESPHPAIKPDFPARYVGFLVIAQAGTYQFDTKGTLTLNGEILNGARKLEAGKHPLTLTYRRESGAVRFGVCWESEHFVKEPLPPTPLTHTPAALTSFRLLQIT